MEDNKKATSTRSFLLWSMCGIVWGAILTFAAGLDPKIAFSTGLLVFWVFPTIRRFGSGNMIPYWLLQTIPACMIGFGLAPQSWPSWSPWAIGGAIFIMLSAIQLLIARAIYNRSEEPAPRPAANQSTPAGKPDPRSTNGRHVTMGPIKFGIQGENSTTIYDATRMADATAQQAVADSMRARASMISEVRALMKDGISDEERPRYLELMEQLMGLPAKKVSNQVNQEPKVDFDSIDFSKYGPQ